MNRTCALLTAALLTLSAATAAATPQPKFIGKWRVVSAKLKGKTQRLPQGITMTMEFKRGGELLATMTLKSKGKQRSKVEKGTWELKASILTVSTPRPEKMTYIVKGSVMVLKKLGQTGTGMILRRLE